MIKVLLPSVQCRDEAFVYLNQYLKIDSDTIISFIYAISFNFIELDSDIKRFKLKHSKLGNLAFCMGILLQFVYR